MNLQTGDIILIKGSTPIISPLIRWFTQSTYTHAAMVVTEDLIYEVNINKDLAIRPLKELEYDVFRCKKNLSKKEKRILLREAVKRSKDNKGYDWMRILAFAIERIIKAPFGIHAKNRVVCSEIVDYLYAAAGIDLVPDREDGYVAPGHIANSPLLFKVATVRLYN